MSKLVLIIIIAMVFGGCGAGSESTNQTPPNPYTSSFKGVYFASSQSDIYHYPSCPFAQQIAVKNLITFETADLAVTQNYRSCQTCNPPLGKTTNYPPVLTTNSPSPSVLTRSSKLGYQEVAYYGGARDINNDLKEVTCRIYSPENIVIDSCSTQQLTSVAGYQSGFTMKKNISTDLHDLPGTYTIETIVTDSGGLTATNKNYITLN